MQLPAAISACLCTPSSAVLNDVAEQFAITADEFLLQRPAIRPDMAGQHTRPSGSRLSFAWMCDPEQRAVRHADRVWRKTVEPKLAMLRQVHTGGFMDFVTFAGAAQNCVPIAGHLGEKRCLQLVEAIAIQTEPDVIAYELDGLTKMMPKLHPDVQVAICHRLAAIDQPALRGAVMMRLLESSGRFAEPTRDAILTVCGHPAEGLI